MTAFSAEDADEHPDDIDGDAPSGRDPERARSWRLIMTAGRFGTRRDAADRRLQAARLRSPMDVTLAYTGPRQGLAGVDCTRAREEDGSAMARRMLMRDASGEYLIAESELPLEKNLHDVLTQHPELLPDADLSLGQLVVGRESSLTSGYADLVLVDDRGQLCLVAQAIDDATPAA